MTPISARPLRIAAIGLASLACLTVTVDLSDAARAASVVAFFLVGPGLALAPTFHIRHAVGQLASAVGISVAMLIIVSEILVYTQVSSAGWVLAILTTATVLAAVPPLVWQQR